MSRCKYILCKKPLDEHKIRLIREIYKPVKINVLFVGESPPANRQCFFYCESCMLYSAVREAFEQVFDMEGHQFLDFFRGIGCYLYDLFDEPGVIVPVRAPRKNQRPASDDEVKKAVDDLNKFIRREEPEVIVFVLKDVCEAIKRVTERSIEDWLEDKSIKQHVVIPFPSSLFRRKFIEELKQFLKKLVEKGIIKVPSYRIKK